MRMMRAPEPLATPLRVILTPDRPSISSAAEWGARRQNGGRGRGDKGAGDT